MTLLLTFIQKAIGQGVAILFGASGEIVTEKSGNLNLGIPGIMYMGGIAGLMGAFFYEKSTETPNGAIGVLVSLLCSLIASALGGLIYSFLTITLRANQNVVGLALTTFGVGFGNFFGGSISKLAGGFRSDNGGCIPRHYSGTLKDPGDRNTFLFLWIPDISVRYRGGCHDLLFKENKKRTELKSGR